MTKKRDRDEIEVRTNFPCLLIIVKEPVIKADRVETVTRHFFTKKKNLLYLVEFSKTFSAEIKPVRVVEAEILPLKDLARAFCNPQYNYVAEYKVETAKPAPQHPVGQKKNPVRSYITKRLLQGQPISVKNVSAKMKVSESTVRRHLKTVRAHLEISGYRIENKQGEYFIRDVIRSPY